MFKCLIIYCNTCFLSNLKSPMQISQSRSTRSDLLRYNMARHQLGLNPDHLRSKYRKGHLPSHGLHLGQHAMYQDSTNKQWFPATITSICSEPRSYKTIIREGVTYRRTQSYIEAIQSTAQKK